MAQDGQSRRFVTDDDALDGGTGTILRQASTGPGWQLTVYDPTFRTPDWTRGAVVYQVFPDRFANGDTANDPSPDATPGPDGAARFRHGDVYGNRILAKAWDERPEGYCRAYQELICEEQPLGRDFYGGDLAGITAHLDDLAARGITALYLNPIFAAPSNHRYDTSDYFTIDPDLGTEADFDTLIARAHERGIKVILDGVFNHVSSDSPWFDRLGRYEEVGACESADSPYRSWFTFRAPGPGEPSPCAPSTPGGDDTYYTSWAGFDTIPALVETPEVVDLITGAGWRRAPLAAAGHRRLASRRGRRPQPGAAARHPCRRQGRGPRLGRHRGAMGRFLEVAARRPGRLDHGLPLPAGDHRPGQRSDGRPGRVDRRASHRPGSSTRCWACRRTTRTRPGTPCCTWSTATTPRASCGR